MPHSLNAVTGATGYTGKYITKRLLEKGERVVNITGHPGRVNPFGGKVASFPFNFDNPSKLVKSLEGVGTLYNTYWVRFPHGGMTYDKAVENTMAMIDAAEKAGVKRMVHISIANASPEAKLPYYQGKAELEDYIKASRLTYAIIRPTVLFGKEDILINNIAWLLRHFPVFGIPGTGEYGIQPVYVEDVAELAVNAGEKGGNLVIDAAGPEKYTFNELVSLIARSIGSRSMIIHVPAVVALNFSRLAGVAVGDVVLTGDEVRGLMEGILVSKTPPACNTSFAGWLERNKGSVGAEYRSELRRHYR